MASTSRNHPSLEKYVLGVWIALEGCYDYLDAAERCKNPICDGQCCDENMYDDIRGVEFLLTHAESIITSTMTALPDNMHWLNNHGFTPARTIVDLLRSWLEYVAVYGLDAACACWLKDWLTE